MKQLDNGKVELEVGDSLVYGNSAELGEDINIVKFIKNGRIYSHTEHFCKHRKFGHPDEIDHKWSLNGIVYAEEDIILPQDQPTIKFENEQHERLHNVLIKAGFTYDNTKSYYRGSKWEHGYYNIELNHMIYWDDLSMDLHSGIFVRELALENCIDELFNQSIETIIGYYESLIQEEQTLGEFQDITPENFYATLLHNKFIQDGSNYKIKDYCMFDKFDDALYFEFFIDDSYSAIIQTRDFDEFITFIQKRIILKPLPKKLDLIEWFNGLDSGFGLHLGSEFYHVYKGDVYICVVRKELPIIKQKELMLKIIKAYKGINEWN